MIVTQTPLRISFVGGGTDMPEFFTRHDGAVISMTINKYVSIILNEKFDGRFRISYSKTENVDTWQEIEHDIVREAMRRYELRGLEIVSVSDIPGTGSGLGSSSAFTVGLINAICAHIGHGITNKALAEEAYKLERSCGHPVGKQDHYAAACGGLTHYLFQKNGVKMHTFGLLDEEYAMVWENLMLYWTGVSRSSDEILRLQSADLDGGKRAWETGLLMYELTTEVKEAFDQHDFTHLGRVVGVDWKLKKNLAAGITADWIDTLIVNAMNAGAQGAKICGAGGGGFLLVVAPPHLQDRVHAALGGAVVRVPFKVERRGSRVVFAGDK